ncbi:MAG TPA: helix-turn-helix domain-containing protein [Mycobacteriales bacterium]|nr:helix-turn-helix domain-containing protein [Mycobacteriales bacterium]
MQQRPDPDLVTTRADFARDLSRLREQAGLTVREVARAVGIRDSTAGGYFSGRHLPGPRSQQLLAGIVRVCGVTDPEEVERWVRALVRVRRAPGPRPAGEPAPYRGLATFEPEDERWFHGREVLTRLVVGRIRMARTPVVVTGPSGSGKSSLLRAGLVPALRRERRPDGGPVWDCRVLVPGEHPLDRLRAQPPAAPGSTLVLVVDQFEEVFAGSGNPRAEVVAALVELAATARVVLGLRADFWAAAAAEPALVPALQDAQIVVGPMSAADLRRAITEPARLAAIELEDGLVDVILGDASPRAEAGTLPLLSHALLATWQRGHHGRLTVADYLGSGGIGGAIAQTAESIHLALPPEQRELSRRLFLRLVHVDDDPGSGIGDTRRRVPRAELEDAGLLDRYVEQRLLTVDASTVEIAHEALLTAWPRLREWVDADRAGLRVHRQLTDAARVWQQAGRDPQALLRGGRLAAAAEWAADHEPALNQAERAFLDASRAAAAAAETARRRRTRRLRALLAAACALLLLSGGLAGVLFQQRRVAESQRDAAISRRVATDADRLREVDRNLAMQLALAAYRIAPTVEARSSLIDSSAMPTATRLLGAPGLLQAVAVTPDGGTVAAGGADGQVRLWDVPTRRLAGTLTGSAGPSPTVFTVTAGPDGRTLATGGTDGQVRLWSLADRAHPRQLAAVIGATGPQPTVFATAYAPDGRTLAAGGADRVVRLWSLADPARPRPLGTLGGPRGYVQALAFSPDGRTLAAGSADHDVYRWDVRRRVPLGPPLTGAAKTVFAVAYSPDGRLLAAGSADKTVHLWAGGVLQPALAGATSWVNALAFSPDGSRLAAGGSDNEVRIWSATGTRPLLARLPHPGPVTGVRYAGSALVTSATDGAVRVWPALPGPVLRGFADAVFSVHFTGADRLVTAAGTADNTVRTWDVHDPRRPVPVGRPVRGPAADGVFTGAMAVSPDGATIATGSRDGTVRLWRGGTATVLRGPRAEIESVEFSPDGRTVAASSNDFTVWVWPVDHPGAGRALTGATNYVYGVAFDPTGRYLAAGSVDDRVRIWDLRGRAAPLATLTDPTSYAITVAFSPDGRTLVAGSADSRIYRWDVRDPAHPVAEPPLTGPRNYVWGVTFSRDGGLLAAAAGDRTIWAWDTTHPGPPRLTLRLTGAADSLLTLDFRPDGKWLAAGSADALVRLWNLDVEQVARYVCATAGDPLTRAEWDRYVTGAPYRPPCR